MSGLRNPRCQGCGVPADEFGQDRKVAATVCPSLPQSLAVFFFDRESDESGEWMTWVATSFFEPRKKTRCAKEDLGCGLRLLLHLGTTEITEGLGLMIRTWGSDFLGHLGLSSCSGAWDAERQECPSSLGLRPRSGDRESGHSCPQRRIGEAACLSYLVFGVWNLYFLAFLTAVASGAGSWSYSGLGYGAGSPDHEKSCLF